VLLTDNDCGVESDRRAIYSRTVCREEAIVQEEAQKGIRDFGSLLIELKGFLIGIQATIRVDCCGHRPTSV
jgi:hypothetical protein